MLDRGAFPLLTATIPGLIFLERRHADTFLFCPAHETGTLHRYF